MYHNHRYPIFSMRYSVTCKVYTGYNGKSQIEHALCTCTVDNALAKARGLSFYCFFSLFCLIFIILPLLHGPPMLVDKTKSGLVFYNHASFYRFEETSSYWLFDRISVFCFSLVNQRHTSGITVYNRKVTNIENLGGPCIAAIAGYCYYHYSNKNVLKMRYFVQLFTCQVKFILSIHGSKELQNYYCLPCTWLFQW